MPLSQQLASSFGATNTNNATDMTFFAADSKLYSQPMPIKIGTHQFKTTNTQNKMRSQ